MFSTTSPSETVPLAAVSVFVRVSVRYSEYCSWKVWDDSCVQLVVCSTPNPVVELNDVLTVVLVTASLIAAIMLLRTMPDLDSDIYTTDQPISEQYRDIMPPISEGGYVRLTTPFFNVYGLITLVGGALWSTYLFWRKRVLPNRVIGNVLIAVGALIIASASTLTRMGYGSVLYLGELLAGVLMFAGFLVAAAPRAGSASDDEAEETPDEAPSVTTSP